MCDDRCHYVPLTADVLFAVLIRDACPIRSGWVEIIIVTGKKLIIWNQNRNWVWSRRHSLIKKDLIE